MVKVGQNNKRLKIAMIGVRGIPGTSGGAEIVVEEISTALVEKGADVTVFCRPHYTAEKKAFYKDVKLRYIPCINTKHLEAITHTIVCSIIASFSDYDIVHYHSIGPSLMSWIPRLFGKKVVSTCHGLDWQRGKWGKLAKILLKLGERSSAVFPHATTVVSEILNTYYQEVHRRETYHIPNGITVIEGFMESDFLRSFNLYQDKYILFLSRIVPEKGLHYLIKAFKEVDTELKLVIAGAASHSDNYYNDMVKLAEDDPRIIFTGAVYGDDKATLFSNALFFVLPSDLEGMPIVLMESMSFGCVPLVSDIPINKSMVQGGNGPLGFSFKAGNVDDLQNVIKGLLDKPQQVLNLRKQVKEYVTVTYDWQMISDQYLNLYSELVYNLKPVVNDDKVASEEILVGLE